MAKEGQRDKVSDHYCGHNIDIDTAEDHNVVLESGAEDSPIMKGESADEDTQVKLGPKTPEYPNDPYNPDRD